MASNPRRKSDAARRANQVIRSRTVLVMLLLGIVTFAVLFWKLYDIQIRQHSVLQEKASSSRPAAPWSTPPEAPFMTETSTRWPSPPRRRT